MKKLLADEFDIHNDKQLEEALKKSMIDISIFCKKEESEDERKVV